MHIVVLGYIVRGPYGGLVWHHLQYVLGLKKIGHEVLFLEDSDNYPSCSSPSSPELGINPSYGLQFIHRVFHQFNLKNNWAYYDAHTDNWYGASRQKVETFCNSASFVLNLSRINPLRDWWCRIPNRIFIDTDPAFTQIRHLTNKNDYDLAQAHTAFFSFGENIGKPDCLIPDDGFKWRATRQPVYLDAWKYGEPNISAKWTTVMQWDSYKKQTFKGKIYGMKSFSFSEFEKMPNLSTEQFELALGSATAPTDDLKQKGWGIISSLIPTKTPCTYQQYIEQSKGEWSVAKHGYVTSNSGWFSERSLCYMASSKPVVVQETGFSKFIETGSGLFSFTSPEESVAAIEAINRNYSAHCHWAREIAEEYFRFDKVLSVLLENCDNATPIA